MKWKALASLIFLTTTFGTVDSVFLGRVAHAVTRSAAKRANELYQRGERLSKANKYAEAAQAYRQAIRLNPAHANAYAGLGNVLGLQGKFEEELMAYQTAARLNPRSDKIQFGLGYAYGDLQRWMESLRAHRRAVQLNPRHAKAFANIGWTYNTLRRYKEAGDAYERAVSLQPRNVDTRNWLGRVYSSQGRISDAIHQYRIVVRLAPKNAAAHASLGKMLEAQGRYREALPLYQRAVQLAPQSSDSRSCLAYWYMHTGSREVGLQHFAKAIALAQMNVKKMPSAGAYYDLGYALHNTKRWAEAIAAFDGALRYDALNADSLRLASFDSLFLGHGSEAARYGRGYLKIIGWKNSQSPYVALTAYFGLRQAGRNEEARSFLARAASQLDTGQWPYPVIRYLQGGLNEEQLCQAVGQNHNRKTEAWAYIGAHLALNGQAQKSLPYLRWVEKYGNKNYIESDLAARELPRAEAAAKAATKSA